MPAAERPQPGSRAAGSYDDIARYYEMEQGEYEEDLWFYSQMAQRTGGPILDLGGGSGRLAIRLAQDGHRVTSVDASAGMLRLARAKVPATLRRRITLLHQDMRQLDVPRNRFALAVMAAGTFAHLTTREDQSVTLDGVRESLAPGGLLVLGLQNPCEWAVDRSQDEILFGWERPGPDPGETTRLSYAVHSDRALQLRHLRLWYDVTAGEHLLRRVSASFDLRWTYRPELDLLLKSCGFVPEACYGSYDLEPYDTESPLLLAVASVMGATNVAPPVFSLVREAEHQEVPGGATGRARATKPETHL